MDLQHLSNKVKQFPEELKNIIQILGNSKVKPYFPSKYQDFNWDFFITLIQQHQLTSLIFPYLSKNRDNIPTAAYDRIKSIQQRNAQKALAHVEQTIRLQSLFNKEGIPAIFLKGVALSQILYGDPLLKNSIDIDVLVSLKHIGQAAELLQKQGYRMIYPDIRLSKRQKRINYRISHHYDFQHPEKGVRVELHWKLINPQVLLPFSFDFLYRRSVKVKLHEHPVNTLSMEDYIIYLSVHGAKHRWYNLAWLKDLSQILEETSQQTKLKTFRLSEEMGLKICFLQGCLISRLIYGVETVVPLPKNQHRLMLMVRKALDAIPEYRTELKSHKLRNLLYQLWLRRNLKYKLTLIFRLRTHHSDWSRVPLPDYLFFLYYPLRPLIYMMNKVKNKIQKIHQGKENS
ncbi:MAG: nucleotidyltransferase family protein [Bacteroidota bacterium]